LRSSMKRCRFSLASIAKVFVMPAQKEFVGHAGDVIANDDVACFHPREFFIGSRHRAVRSQVVAEKLLETVHGAFAVLGNDRMVVDMCEEEALELTISRGRSSAEPGEAMACPTYVFHG